jgi:hypothetical protein
MFHGTAFAIMGSGDRQVKVAIITTLPTLPRHLPHGLHLQQATNDSFLGLNPIVRGPDQFDHLNLA